jgi:hypothetical protein
MIPSLPCLLHLFLLKVDGVLQFVLKPNKPEIQQFG